jgi:ATP phosphoribosyltransferase
VVAERRKDNKHSTEIEVITMGATEKDKELEEIKDKMFSIKQRLTVQEQRHKVLLDRIQQLIRELDCTPQRTVIS